MRKNFKIAILMLLIIVIGIITFDGIKIYNSNKNYKKYLDEANSNMSLEKYDNAIFLYQEALEYKKNTSINKQIEIAKLLKKSKENYDLAVKQVENKRYLEAIDLLKKVDKQDSKRHLTSQDKINECVKLYIAENLNSANENFKNNKYDDSNKYLDNIFKVDASNKEALNLKNHIIETIKNEEQIENSPKELNYGVGDVATSIHHAELSLKFIDKNKLDYCYSDERNANGIVGILHHYSGHKWKGCVMSARYGEGCVMLTILKDKAIIEEVYLDNYDFNSNSVCNDVDVLEQKFKNYDKKDLFERKIVLPRINRFGK